MYDLQCTDVRTRDREAGVEEIHTYVVQTVNRNGYPRSLRCQGLRSFYTPTLQPGQGTSQGHRDLPLHLAPIGMYLEDTLPTGVPSQVGGCRSDEPQFTVPPKMHLEAWDIQSEQPEQIKQR